MTHTIEPLLMNIFSKWLTELKSFFNMTQRIEPFLFSKMTQRIESFLHLTQRVEPFFLKFHSKTWTFFEFDSMSWIFLIRLKELNFFLNMTQRIEPFFFEYEQRIEPMFFEYDAKNWTLVLWTRRKELNPFSLNMTQRLEPFFSSDWKNVYDSKNWTFF